MVTAAAAGGMMAAAMANTAIVASTISAAIGVASSIQQGKQAQAQANYQAKVAQENAKLADQQASATRKEAYDEMTAQRQKTAKLIGAQRAAAGASGAAVDVGSVLDTTAETAAQGELDAINIYNKGIDSAYNSQLQAWNYRQNASAYKAQGEAAKKASYMDAASSAIGGIADVASTWGKWQNFGTKSSTGGKYWDRALGQYTNTNMTYKH